jgi:hypothetical protein
MLAAPMARDLGLATPTVFAAFSLALLVVGGARAVRRPGDRPLGRPAGAGREQPRVRRSAGRARPGAGSGGDVRAWVLIGVGMATRLYEAAFAALVRLHGHDSRNLITGITLFAGFASTVGWPLTTCSKPRSAGAVPASRGRACTCCSACRSTWRCRAPVRRRRHRSRRRRRCLRPRRRRGPARRAALILPSCSR